MSGDRLRLAFCGFHPERAQRLVAEWGSARAVLRAVALGQVKASPAAREAAAVPAERRSEELAALGVEAVFRWEPAFPGRLAELPDAPEVLFMRGVVPDVPAVAVVGTRRCTRYGRGLARAFGQAIAQAGWLLVSGLARGIDGEAHCGTVDGGGLGVAVLGSGPDVWYPREHRPLGERLVDSGGGVVTEYPPGAAPEPWRFPLRNRIISGIARVVVVVEAGEKGGALITARTALEQGRDVFVVPGDVDRPASRGCNLLIRDGAHPVLGTDDLLEALSLVLGPPRAATSRPSADGALLDAVGDVGRSIDELAVELNQPISDMLAEITRLEAAGRLRIAGNTVSMR